MSGPGPGDGDDHNDGDGGTPAGTWPPETERAVPTGAPDAYAPGYVPPPADPAHDNAHAEEGPPAGLYPVPVDTAARPTPDATSSPESVDAPDPLSPSSELAAPDEEPLLPAALATAGALQDAVGAPSERARRRAKTPPRRDDDDGSAAPRNRRTMMIASLSIVVGLGTAVLIFLGRANEQRYVITCDAAHAVAEQGRSFPPWGTHPLHGPEWAPITLPANAECQPRETENLGELGSWYLGLLVERATATLTARDLLESVGATTNPLDAVSAQLDQALLLARDPDRRDQRKEITRLQGDVDYWRAAARLRDASAVLLDAAKQFETANQQNPRHATDAAAWSALVHRVVDELHAGPTGAVPVATGSDSNAVVTGSEPAVPVGTALPVEPEAGSAGSAAPPPDAGVPSGGVLL